VYIQKKLTKVSAKTSMDKIALPKLKEVGFNKPSQKLRANIDEFAKSAVMFEQ